MTWQAEIDELRKREELGRRMGGADKMAEIETRLKALTSPFRSAESFIVEEIVDPRDTRRLLCEFAELAAPLRTPGRTAFGIRP